MLIGKYTGREHNGRPTFEIIWGLKKMTNYDNAKKLYDEYIRRPRRKNIVNVCEARPNWNGCDFCDVYKGHTGECWKQNGKHSCIYAHEKYVVRKNYNIYVNTKTEKYDVINIARNAGAIVTGVSGCGTGYYIQIDATEAQAGAINSALGGAE